MLTPSKNVKIFDFLLSSTSKHFDHQYIEQHTLAKHPRKHSQQEIVEQGGDYDAANLSIKQTVSCQLKQLIRESENQIRQPIFRYYLMLELPWY